MHPFGEDPDGEDSIRATVQMSPLQLETILVHERTTEDIVIKLEHRKRRWNPYHLIAVSFFGGIALGAATVSIF